MEIVGGKRQFRGKGCGVKAGKFARLHSTDHKSLILLPMLKMIALKVDIGPLPEAGAISRQEINT